VNVKYVDCCKTTNRILLEYGFCLEILNVNLDFYSYFSHFSLV